MTSWTNISIMNKMDKIDQLINSLLTFTLILFQEIQYQGSSKEAVWSAGPGAGMWSVIRKREFRGREPGNHALCLQWSQRIPFVKGLILIINKFPCLLLLFQPKISKQNWNWKKAIWLFIYSTIWKTKFCQSKYQWFIQFYSLRWYLDFDYCIFIKGAQSFTEQSKRQYTSRFGVTNHQTPV